MSTNWVSHIDLSSVQLSPTASDVQLFIGPEDNLLEVISNAIAAAKKSIWIEMYCSESNMVPTLLEEQAKAGIIDVQLLYEKKPLGGANQKGLSLSPDGLFPPPGYSWAHPSQAQVFSDRPRPVTYTHAKLMLIDAGVPEQEQAYIMTTNFTESALGNITVDGTYVSSWNREYIVRDTNSQDIKVLSDIFYADANGNPPPSTLTSIPHLLVSSDPYKTREASVHAILHKLIDSAQSSICLQVEDMIDPQVGNSLQQGLSIEQALIDASKHVPEVKVMLPSQVAQEVDDNGYNIQQRLTVAGSQVQIQLDSQHAVQGKLVAIHGKVIIVDQSIAFVGSQDFSRGSLNSNREFGILISDDQSVKRLYATFQQDWQPSQS